MAGDGERPRSVCSGPRRHPPTVVVAAGARLHQLCVSLQSALAAEADSGSEHDTTDPAPHTAAGLLDSSDNSGEEGGAEAAALTQQRPKDTEERNFVTAIATVNVDGLPLELSELAIQTALEAQKSRKPGTSVAKKAGKKGRAMCKVGPGFDFGDGTDGRTVVTAKQHRLASMVTTDCSIAPHSRPPPS